MTGRGTCGSAQTRLPNEPATGQKPVTAADRIKVMMAMKGPAMSVPETAGVDKRLAAR